MANLLQKGLVLVIVGLFTVGSALAQEGRSCVTGADTPRDVAGDAPADPNKSLSAADEPAATSAQTPGGGRGVVDVPCTNGECDSRVLERECRDGRCD